MCFSAETSFSAGAVLTVSGIILVKKFYKTKAIFLALAPIVFGIQQFAEGVLWEALKHETYPNSSSLFAQYIYLFFAYMFWPVWVPFAFCFVERVLWRQIVMGGLMLMGFLFFLSLGYIFIVEGVEPAKIIEHSIDYGSIPLSYRILYGIVSLTPLFLSSIPRMWILGIANTLAFIVADVFYHYAFTSVWCGAVAIFTIGLFILLKEDSIKPIPNNK